jgi:hypothetical protein
MTSRVFYVSGKGRGKSLALEIKCLPIKAKLFRINARSFCFDKIKYHEQGSVIVAKDLLRTRRPDLDSQ